MVYPKDPIRKKPRRPPVAPFRLRRNSLDTEIRRSTSVDHCDTDVLGPDVMGRFP